MIRVKTSRYVDTKHGSGRRHQLTSRFVGLDRRIRPHEANLIATYEAAVPLIQSEAYALLDSRRNRRIGIAQEALETAGIITADALSADNIDRYLEVRDARDLAGRADGLYARLPAPDVAETTGFVNEALGVTTDLARLQNEVLS